MAAKFMDIIPPNKRSIRNIPLSMQVEDEPDRRGFKAPSKDHLRELLEIEERGNKSGRAKSIWALAVLSVAVLSLIIVSKFATATVTIIKSGSGIPISMNVNLSHSASSSDSVDFDVVTLTLSQAIPASAVTLATGTAALGTKAKGTVILYNNYSSQSQILLKNTKLEAPGGKIFLLVDKVTIPGQSKIKGVVGPGTVVAKVVAEKEGASYNIALASGTFTLPSLKSSPRYKLVYAKIKTSIGGGSDAKSKILVDSGVMQGIHNVLSDNAIKQIEAQKADGYLLINGGTQESLEIKSGNSASLDLSALLIKKSDLALLIQSEKNLDIKISPGNAESVLVDATDLKVGLPSSVNLNSLDDEDGLKINLSGTTSINSDFSDDIIKSEIAGESAETAEKILTDKVGVAAANLEIWPWWVKTVPSNPSRITIELENS